MLQWHRIHVAVVLISDEARLGLEPRSWLYTVCDASDRYDCASASLVQSTHRNSPELHQILAISSIAEAAVVTYTHRNLVSESKVRRQRGTRMKRPRPAVIGVLLPGVAYAAVVGLTERVFWDTSVPSG
jgi:hypothetical protein